MLAAAHGVISQLQVLYISKCISWMLWIPVFCQLSQWGSDLCDQTPVPLSLIQYTYFVPLFLRCYVICHVVLIAQCGKSCDSHWDLITCIIGYLNPNLTLNWYCGPLWYFVRWGLQSHHFPLDQTNWFLELLDLYSSQWFCEQVHRVILPWDVTYHDLLILDLFLYIVVLNIHMSNPHLLCRICG